MQTWPRTSTGQILRFLPTPGLARRSTPIRPFTFTSSTLRITSQIQHGPLALRYVRPSAEGTELTPKLVVQIASSAGETTAPPHSKQPNGDSIPWGVGALRSGSSVASREKHYSSSSDEEEDSDESSSSGDSEDTSQRSSSSKAKGGSDDDEETPTTGTSSSKGGSAKSSEDSEDSEVSEDDETTSSTKSGSSKSTLKDAEEDSKVSDTTTSKNSGTQGGNGSVTDAEAEESELEVPVSTSSRLKTVHSKPTSTPLPTGNINAVTPTLPLPSPPSSAQPVGCAGGINATSSYCSPSSTANYATYASKLDLRSFLVVVSVCLYGLL